MLAVEGIRKAFGALVAVDGLSFRVEAGAIFGLLGPNGAGKTTAIACVSGIERLDAGRVRIAGHDLALEPRRARRHLGYVPQEIAVHEELGARANLLHWGAVQGLRGPALRSRCEALLERFELTPRAREPVARLSGGMQRRLNLACGIVHRPRLLLLDEPTVGLDPEARARLLALVREEAAAGAAVLYTTHYLEEAEALCDRIGVLDRGRLLFEGDLNDLRRRVGGRDQVRLEGRFDPARVAPALDALGQGAERIDVAQATPDVLVLTLTAAPRRLPALFRALTEAGAEIHETTLGRPNLEALFLALTGERA